MRSANVLQAHKKASVGRKNWISMSLVVGQEDLNLTCSQGDSYLAKAIVLVEMESEELIRLFGAVVIDSL